MTKITLNRKNSYLTNVEVRGHSGNPIVCSSISTIMYFTTLVLIGHCKFTVDEKEPNFSLDVYEDCLKQNDTAVSVINAMVNMLFQLNKQYPDNVAILEQNIK